MGNYIKIRCPIDGSQLINDMNPEEASVSCYTCGASYRRYFNPEDLKKEARAHIERLELDKIR